MTASRCARHQRGAITVLVTLGLVTLAALTSFFSARSVLVDRLASRNHAQAVQARLAADAALAGAQALIAGHHDQVHTLFSVRSDCPAGVIGAQWQCSALQITPHPALPQVLLSATLARDLVRSPHVIGVHASARVPGQHSQAQVRESLFAPVLAPAPNLASSAALVLNGCLSEAPGARLRVCPLNRQGVGCADVGMAPAVHTHFVADANQDGQITPAEIQACLALGPASLPRGGEHIAPTVVVSRKPCTRAAWQSVLGDMRNDQLRDWSNAQERQGLSARTQPPRTIYWVDTPGDWTHSVGTADHPVLLVFSALACSPRCPRIATGAHIVGTVVVDAGCDDEKMRDWQAGTIEGQLVVESGLPAWRSGTVMARPESRQAYRLHWPQGMDATRLQRIHGSWSEGTP